MLLNPKIRGLNILLAEDDEFLRKILVRGLIHEGFKVTAVCSGKESLRCLEVQSYDLLITDLIMEQGEGVETIRQARRRWPDMRIIAMSGGGRTAPIDYLMIAVKLGANRAIAKPFTLGELEHVIESCYEELPL